MSNFLSNYEGKHLTLQEYYHINVIDPSDTQLIIDNNQILNIIYQNIKPIIENYNIKFYFVPLPPSELDIWWTDYAEEYLKVFYGKEFKNNSHLILTIKLNEDMSIYSEESIKIDHSLKLEERQIVRL